MVKQDPEENETRALFELAVLYGKRVLEIGSGDGRLTRRYAHKAAEVVAIEPFEESFMKARAALTDELAGKVDFQHITFEDYAQATETASFDIAILSWSL